MDASAACYVTAYAADAINFFFSAASCNPGWNNPSSLECPAFRDKFLIVAGFYLAIAVALGYARPVTGPTAMADSSCANACVQALSCSAVSAALPEALAYQQDSNGTWHRVESAPNNGLIGC